MAETDFGSYDPSSPRARYERLLHLAPDRATARKHHPELLDIFRREMKFRKDGCPAPDDEFDYADSIYWCALLLYFVGDLADVLLMWEAKNIDFDLRCGFDWQFFVGAGVDETIKYLEDQSQEEAADYLKGQKAAHELDDLPGWEKFRIGYFYPQFTAQGHS
jgi:hypothetical protein